MFSIRPAREEDCQEIFEQTKMLFSQHEDQGAGTRLTATGLQQIYHDQIVRFLVLTTPEDGTERVIGFISFEDEVDLNFGGPGVTVDQFFILEGFRGLGKGKLLIEAVCAEALRSGAKYLKLFYQHDPNRGEIYSRMGFINVTSGPPHVRFFEIYEPPQLLATLGLDVLRTHGDAPLRTILVRQGIEVVRYQQARDAPDGYGLIMLSVRIPSHTDQQPTLDTTDHPGNQLIVIIRHSLRLHSLPGLFELVSLKSALQARRLSLNVPAEALWRQISETESESDEDLMVAAFVERGSVCCWLGRMMTFSNFVGDLQLVSRDVLVNRIRAWNQTSWGPVLGANFEVADSPGQKHLTDLFNSLGMFDETHWNCAVMPEEAIRAKAMTSNLPTC